jgi:phospholipase/carboxylesterase
MLFHRTGGDEGDLLETGSRLAPGASLLGLRGPVVEDGKARFFRRLEKGKFDLEDLSMRIDQLEDFVGWAKEHYKMERPVAVGFSNGANMIWATILRYPRVFHGAILLRPMCAFQPRTKAGLDGLPVLVIAGTSDGTVPPSQAEEIPNLLKSANGNVTFEWVAAAHELCEADIEKSARWLRRIFGS